MPDSHQLILKEPISGLNAALNLDLKAFFINTAKFAVAAANGEASDSVEYGINTLSPKAEPDQIAWELIVRSFLEAFSRTTREYKDLLNIEVTEKSWLSWDKELNTV